MVQTMVLYHVFTQLYCVDLCLSMCCSRRTYVHVYTYDRRNQRDISLDKLACYNLYINLVHSRCVHNINNIYIYMAIGKLFLLARRAPGCWCQLFVLTRGRRGVDGAWNNGIYHGIYHGIHHGTFTMVCTMVYSMVPGSLFYMRFFTCFFFICVVLLFAMTQ